MQLVKYNPAERGKKINPSRCYPGELVSGEITAPNPGAPVTVEW